MNGVREDKYVLHLFVQTNYYSYLENIRFKYGVLERMRHSVSPVKAFWSHKFCVNRVLINYFECKSNHKFVVAQGQKELRTNPS